MSIDATRWAWKQELRPASMKLVLMSLADRANAKHEAYPSAKLLALDTCLDRKTVDSSLKQLEANGVISDTGERKGRTKSVKVWQLIGVVGRHDDESIKEIKHRINARNEATPKTGKLIEGTPKTDKLSIPENGERSLPENGEAKHTRKRVIEPISNNLPIEPSPLTPKSKEEGRVISQEENQPPERMPQELPEQVQAIYNEVQSEYSNAKPCSFLNYERHILGIKRIYETREMIKPEYWDRYFHALMSSKCGKSMKVITLQMAVKERTFDNTHDGIYDEVEISA